MGSKIHITCECGNNVDVSNADAEVRCPRCGRRVSAGDDDFRHLLDEYHIQPAPAGNETPSNFQPADIPVNHQASCPQAKGNIEETIPCTVTPAAEAPVTHPRNHPQASETLSFAVNSDVENHFSNGDSSIVRESSHSDGHSGGSGHGTKYDLSERVMRPLAKPIVPVVPYAGIGDYGIHHVLRPLQQGGMGRILVAYDRYLKREVALKELRSDIAGDESIVRRFIGEAEITALLEHPGVVPIHQIGQGHDAIPYYTMKMVKGKTLQEAIKAYHRKPSRGDLYSLIRRLVSVSKTIAFAHSRGVIHRDLKPANVMVGEHGETLVMDWGLAKLYDQGAEEHYASVIHQTRQKRPELTMVGAIVGTPAFMSPEQALAEDSMVGPLSDVFSLGTVLYYLLTGQTAFSGRSAQDVLNKVRACAPPPPPSHVKPSIPHGLEAICLKAMARLPEDRYQGASEFADDLCRWLDDEPIVAEKPSLWTKMRWWMLRHRTLTIAVPCILFFSLLLACISTWIFVENYSTSSVPGNEHSSMFQCPLQVTQEPKNGNSIWVTTRPTGELLITCNIDSAAGDSHHVVSLRGADGTHWDLSKEGFLSFSLLTAFVENAGGLRNFSVRLGQDKGEKKSYHEYQPSKKLWESQDQSNWVLFKIPLKEADGDWKHHIVGEAGMKRIEWMEIHFETDSKMVLNFEGFMFGEK